MYPQTEFNEDFRNVLTKTLICDKNAFGSPRKMTSKPHDSDFFYMLNNIIFYILTLKTSEHIKARLQWARPIVRDLLDLI